VLDDEGVLLGLHVRLDDDDVPGGHPVAPVISGVAVRTAPITWTRTCT
jgi:hypothetical protein